MAPVVGEKITYIRLNTPMPCPPRGACPRSTARTPTASFIGHEPEQYLSRDATGLLMSRHFGLGENSIQGSAPSSPVWRFAPFATLPSSRNPGATLRVVRCTGEARHCANTGASPRDAGPPAGRPGGSPAWPGTPDSACGRPAQGGLRPFPGSASPRASSRSTRARPWRQAASQVL